MSHITIRWDGSDGKVTLSPSFKELYDVARLDCLRDAIWELDLIYKSELERFQQPITKDKGEGCKP